MARFVSMVDMEAKMLTDRRATKCTNCEFTATKSEWKQQAFMYEVFIWQEFM